MRHRTALLCAILTVATAVAAVPGPASAAVPGFQVQFTELPGEFAAGASPSTVTVVASTNRGRRCQKVRWSMLMRVTGIRLDQVRVNRVEETGSFPLAVRADGDTARLTDVDVDPGELCRGRTVTARYQMSFAREATDGQVTLQAEAYDTTRRLLQAATATRGVVGGTGVEPSEEPAPAPTENAPAEEESTGPADEAGVTSPTEDPIPAAGAAGPRGAPSLLGAGLAVGAVLIFLGVGLLLRLRLRNQRTDRLAATRQFHPDL